MKHWLPCLAILMMALLLSAGCATSSGGGHQSTGMSPNSAGGPTSPPGQVYTQPVAVPPSNP